MHRKRKQGGCMAANWDRWLLSASTKDAGCTGPNVLVFSVTGWRKGNRAKGMSQDVYSRTLQLWAVSLKR